METVLARVITELLIVKSKEHLLVLTYLDIFAAL